LEQQVVLESDSPTAIQERYQAAAASVSTLIDDTIPTEKDQEKHAPLMGDVLKLLKSIQAFAAQMRKAVSTISTFEKEFIEITIHLGVPQDIVMHLYRGGYPYEKEFEAEIIALDKEWSKVKDARDEVDKNTKHASDSMAEATDKVLSMSTEINANVEDIGNNIVEILKLLDKTNKTMSMSLAEQAALRAKTVRENIFNAVVDCGAAGLNASDDTAALQACVDRCDAVFLPHGIYRVSDTLRLRVTAPSTANARVDVQVSVGGVVDTWSVTSGTK
jgi:hypothetical protein